MAQPLVFIIDDDPSVCKALGRLIRSAGLDVETFTSAQVFWEQKHWQASGCIVVDVRMPVMGGLELQERLVRAGCTMPIIFISAHGDPVAREKGLKAGALAYLQKPFDDHFILELVNFALKITTDRPIV